MKITKKVLLVFIFICTICFLSACEREVQVNEIYNVTYTGTISLNDFEEAIQGIIKSTKDSVVGVSNYAYSFGGIELQSTGTGVIYDAEATLLDGSVVDAKDTTNSTNVSFYTYYAITNQHVIKDAYKIRVRVDDIDYEADEKLVYENEDKDLAIIVFECKKYLPLCTFGDSEEIIQGSFVVAIGASNGLEYMYSSTLGIISYPKRYIIEKIGIKKVTNEYIQHDASLSSGNSGGPLINTKGEVIGINSMKIIESGVEGMGFAIPSNIVKEFIKTYEESKEL